VPIYEYACPDCGHEFETIQKVSEPRLTDCPSCDGHQLKKKVSATNFALKGSGWYKDHYGLKSSSGASSESSGESGASSGGSDAAPAASTSSTSASTADSGGASSSSTSSE